ncbi:MAG: hypothetical protein D6822_00405, partial [Cyanobacteria bacterium J149]
MSINLASSQSAIVTDSYGISHIVWADAENGYIWHAVYDSNSETWKDAEAVAFTGNEPVTSLNLVANENLIDGQNPGLAVVWQQGNLNESDFYYTAAQYDSNADLQWLDTPQALTSDQVGDLEPTVTVNDSGEVIVIGSKVNFDNVANLSIKEDTDFYTQTFSVSSSQFSTNTTTITPNAPYSPQLTTDGLVNLGVLTNTTPTTQEAVQSTDEFSGQGVSSETEQQPGQQPVGSWNAQLYFSSNLLRDWELMGSVPQDGFLEKIIEPFMKRWELVGTISGGQNFGWDNTPPSIFLKTNATLEWQNISRIPEVGVPVRMGKPQRPFVFGFNLDSRYDFAPNSPHNLMDVDDILSLTASIKIPLIDSWETAGFFSLDAIGSVGISFNFLGKAIEGETYSPQTLLAGIEDLEVPIIGGAVADGAILVINLARQGTTEGSAAGIIAADIAINVAATFAAFLNGALEGLQPNGSISFPVLSSELVGTAQIPHVPILSAQINGGVRNAYNWGIGDTDSTISLTFPIGIEGRIGPLGFGVNFNPGWYWDILDSNKNEGNSSVSSETDSSELSAQVSGSLITLNFASSLSAIPQPEDFTVSTTDINGNITNIPVFNVIQGNSDTSLILQLENSIPISENRDYTSSDNPQPTSNAVTLSFTNNDNITDSEGNPIANISSIAVSNV